MNLKGVKLEDFVNYKKPSMFLITCFCDWKCCWEIGVDSSICQNIPIAKEEIRDIPNEVLYNLYERSEISKSIVLGGLEPFLQFPELYEFIKYFRERTDDDIVIYTGYYKEEVKELVKSLSSFDNIIIKYGRYIPNRPSRYDEVLGITLASDNQYAERLDKNESTI